MDILSAAPVGYGGYISIWKLLVFLAMFFAWMPLINWVHTDSQAVRTNTSMWTSSITFVGLATLLLWLVVPLFIIGFLLFLLATGGTTLVYIMHRNSLVADFEKVLSPHHLKGLFVDEKKKLLKASRGMELITSNDNTVPLPKPKSPESFGHATICEVFEDIIWRRATEVAFQPGPEEYKLIYVIDGQPTKQPERDKEECDYMIPYLKEICNLDVEEKRKPQTGTFSIKKDGEEYEFQVTTAGSTAGEQLRIKKIEQHNLMKLEELGLTEEQLEEVKTIRDIDHGLVITSGPKKSGVTTTFYALMKNHDPFLNDINTLEKEVAVDLDNITQHEYTEEDRKTKKYSEKFRSIYRMGAKIIGIEDCDAESAKIVIEAAKSGRIIHATVEATSTVNALGQFLKIADDKNVLLDNLVAIINQRLVRKLCMECRQAYQPNKALLKKFNMSSDDAKLLYRPGEVEYDKHGKPIVCEHCQGSGFYGRTGIYETILLTDEITEQCKKAESLQQMSAIFRKSGMLYLQEQSIKKVTDGITSINEVIREFSSASNKKAKKA
ncbi:Type II traffic warden ATPase [Anaerohalosphaera lusitana]|uniref:Type II traffic warden ATPase n=1 Tax=Anaerohalosphaera lusitana TaxID=1936003 RepID=A0A1U9NNG6_9BACT|nr:ATPase, T2SS/T4P/T4SS family [Anaerohalosphaera lusitana]AQT69337.1 Type II traffic warden ATPase [Anaerohalosphaera lusitana]